MNKKFSQLLLISLLSFQTSCSSLIKNLGVAIISKKAVIDSDRVIHDIPYRTDIHTTDGKNLADLYLPPQAKNGPKWPLLIFVHGGSWVRGDKSLTVGKLDVYGNIGRFYANHGIGTLVINYRLLPNTNLPGQIDDVHHALTWAHQNIDRYGGNPNKIFLMGHSAGGQLASHACLDVKYSFIQGCINVSSAGLDMTDEKTYEAGAQIGFYQDKFEKTFGKDWQKKASPIFKIHQGQPPFLTLYAQGEYPALKRQAQHWHETLLAKGLSSKIHAVRGESHERMAVALSHPRKSLAKEIFEFIQTKSQKSR